MTAEVQPRVFISYARADDEPFVGRLHRDLEAAGIDVWWDRDTMASRGRTFLQEIRDAIEAVDRVIAVIGPGAIHSDYVRYEWEHAALYAKGLLPILRLGDYGLVPSELLPEDDQGLAASDLGRLHCPDFRSERSYEEELNELVAIIRQPVPPLASYDGTPPLPPHFLPRSDDLRRLKETVLADVLRPTVITPAKQTVALQGMGGIGKSVLAAAFARAISTRRAMGDGIVWLRAGQDATLLENMKAAGTAFGGAKEDYADEVSARQHLPKVLENKVCLIILDDVWSMEQVGPFRNALGPRCRLLVTTRDGSLVTALGAGEHTVDVLSDEQALALLAEWSGQEREMLTEDALRVARECGNLPFALALCGAMARDRTPWLDLLHALQKADLTFIEATLPEYEFPNVLRALRVSVDMLGREDPAAVGRYHDLAVFPSEAAVPEASVLTLWCRDEEFSEPYARKLLTTLGRKALLTLQGKSPHLRVSFHDLQHDYLRAIAGEGIETLHGTLIDAYRKKCPNGWSTGPNDGYFFSFLPHHMAVGGRHDELKAMLADYDWIEAKLKATDALLVISDYDLVAREPDFGLVQRTLRLSVPALSRDSAHLPSQLIGRLREIGAARIRALVTKAESKADAPWLCPLTVSLIPPGPLLQTFTGHTAGVTSLAVLADGRVVSASDDGTVWIWDVASGESRMLTGHTDKVRSLAVLPDGRVVSGSDDRTLRVWNVVTGESRTLTGHTAGVSSLAVLADGRVVSGSDDRTLRVWDVASGGSRTLTGHTDKVRSLAVLPDGRVVSGSDDRTLRVWNVVTGESRALTGGRSAVSSLAVLADGRVASGSDQEPPLQVWDVASGESRMLTSVTPDNRAASFSPTLGLLLGFLGHRSPVNSLAVLPGGRVVSGSWDKTLRVWNVPRGESQAESRALTGHSGSVTSLAVLPDGRVVSGSRDRTLRVWDVDSGGSRTMTGHANTVTSLAVLPDGRVVSGSEDWKLRVWNVTSGESQALAGSPGHTGKVTSLAVLADGRVVSGSDDRTLRVWNVASGEIMLSGRHGIPHLLELGGLTGHMGNVFSLAVLPDGRVVSGSDDRTLRVWNVVTGESRTLTGHTAAVSSLAVLPDGRVVSGSDDRTLRVWNVVTGESRTLTGHTAAVSSLAVLADGRVVSGSDDRTLRVWDVDSGGSRTLTGHTAAVSSLAVLADGRVVSGSWDKTLRVWDVASGGSRTLTGHTAGVSSLAVLADGRVVSASEDWSAILWDVDRGVPIAKFFGDAAMTKVAAAANDRIVVGSANGAVHILKLVHDPHHSFHEPP